MPLACCSCRRFIAACGFGFIVFIFYCQWIRIAQSQNCRARTAGAATANQDLGSAPLPMANKHIAVRINAL
jgi:hypothetical protein